MLSDGPYIFFLLYRIHLLLQIVLHSLFFLYKLHKSTINLFYLQQNLEVYICSHHLVSFTFIMLTSFAFIFQPLLMHQIVHLILGIVSLQPFHHFEYQCPTIQEQYLLFQEHMIFCTLMESYFHIIVFLNHWDLQFFYFLLLVSLPIELVVTLCYEHFIEIDLYYFMCRLILHTYFSLLLIRLYYMRCWHTIMLGYSLFVHTHCSSLRSRSKSV